MSISPLILGGNRNCVGKKGLFIFIVASVPSLNWFALHMQSHILNSIFSSSS